MAKKRVVKKVIAKKVIPTKVTPKNVESKLKGMKCPTASCNGSGIYCLGFLGAAIYYVSTATGFWMGVVGVIKALVWPAFLIFELLKFIGA